MCSSSRRPGRVLRGVGPADCCAPPVIRILNPSLIMTRLIDTIALAVIGLLMLALAVRVAMAGFYPFVAVLLLISFAATCFLLACAVISRRIY